MGILCKSKLLLCFNLFTKISEILLCKLINKFGSDQAPLANYGHSIVGFCLSFLNVIGFIEKVGQISQFGGPKDTALMLALDTGPISQLQ